MKGEPCWTKNLRKLVALRTVSPLSELVKGRIDIFLAKFGLVRGDGDFWIKRVDKSDVWAYSHIDTKPPGPKKDWDSNPFALTERDNKLIGLGISDAKFQLLNLLLLSEQYPLNLVVDGGEEIGDLNAAKFIDKQNVNDFIIVDGFKLDNRPYKGMMGQLDGEISFDSGLASEHPGRKLSRFFWDSLQKLYQFIEKENIHFNITAANSEPGIRSLTLERFSLRFDIRYTHAQAGSIYRFIEDYCPRIKQHYPPLGVKDDPRTELDVASFSSPLGKIVKNPSRVWVLPGALRVNGNHKPNEWIFPSQVNEHFESLNNFLRMLFADISNR